jgi:hypothetical protein
MRYIAIALALCFTLVPLEAAVHSRAANIHPVKAKRNKARVHRAKRTRSRSRVN